MTHLLPQPPQLLGSPSVLASQPLFTLLSQSPNGAWQLVTPQIPVRQMAVAFG